MFTNFTFFMYKYVLVIIYIRTYLKWHKIEFVNDCCHDHIILSIFPHHTNLKAKVNSCFLLFKQFHLWLEYISSQSKLILKNKSQLTTCNEFIHMKHTRFVQKVLRLKLYLPKLKWTMNKILIFFIIVLLFNTLIPAGSAWILIWKISEVFQLMFLFIEAPKKFFFWYCISFNVLHVLKLYLWDEFSVQKTRKSCTKLGLMSMEAAFLPHFKDLKYFNSSSISLFFFINNWNTYITYKM